MAADLTEAIVTRARANSGLQSLIGSNDNMRFYPVTAPQKPTLPFVVWESVSDVRLNTGGGYAGITRTRVQFRSVAASHHGAVLLDRAVRDAFNAYVGASIVCTNGTVVVLSMEPQSVSESADPERKEYWRDRDIVFQWRDNA